MSWGGPTWSQWYGATQEADQNHDIANHNYAQAQKWKAYAARIEKELDEVWDLYKGEKGNHAGQRKLKEMALGEIEKLDPSNKLLDKNYRNEIITQEYNDEVKKVRR